MIASKNETSLLQELEKEIAELLVNKLEHLDISLDRAAQIAKFTLKSLPQGLSDEEVRAMVPKLDDEYYELSDIVYKHMKDYEEKYKSVVLDEAGDLVSHKHFDEAKQLLDNYFKKKMK